MLLCRSCSYWLFSLLFGLHAKPIYLRCDFHLSTSSGADFDVYFSRLLNCSKQTGGHDCRHEFRG